jgi:hypothetical protein
MTANEVLESALLAPGVQIESQLHGVQGIPSSNLGAS